MKNLKVPLVRQAEASVDCGLACAAMILEYYAIKKSVDELKKSIATDETGSYMPQLGIYFLEQGFQVSIVTMHPGLFVMKEKGLTSQGVKDRLSEVYSHANEQEQLILDYFFEFIERGGVIDVRIPCEEIIQEELLAQRPVLALITSNVLGALRPSFNFHYNVITGIDDEKISVLDPVWDSRGGSKTYQAKEFLYALYASAYGNIDNASIMLIKKV